MMNNDCNCNHSFSTGDVREYPCKQPACIRKQTPDCLATAVIPAITVETTDGITNLANCFVHVINTNTTYYVDDKHRIMIIWAGPVEVADYDIETNPLGLRSQCVYTRIENVYTCLYFDRQGTAHMMSEEYNI